MDSQEPLTLYSENFPPYNYVENGEIKGLSVDLLMEIFRRMDIAKTPADIVILPWTRGYNETQRRKNTILFATTRTPGRETLFKWVGPFGSTTASLITLTSNKVDIKAGHALNLYKYGVVKLSPGTRIILDAGVAPNNIMHINNAESALLMLTRGRFDAWVYDKFVAFWMIESAGLDPDAFKIVHELNISDYYFALNKETDDALVTAMQNALNEIRADKTLLAISGKHLSTTATAARTSKNQQLPVQ